MRMSLSKKTYIKIKEPGQGPGRIRVSFKTVQVQ